MSRWTQNTLLVMALLVSGCEKPAPPPAAVRPVRVMKVADVQEFVGRSHAAQAIANEEVDLSLRVSGPLIELPVKAGDQVKKGDVLARIDPRDYEVKVRTIEGELAAVDAKLKESRIELEVIKKLVAQDAAPARESDRKKAMVDLYAGQKAATEGKLEAARDELNYTRLVAPFDGMIATTYVDNFQTVQAKERVVRLLDLTRVKVQIDLPEKVMPVLAYVKEINCAFHAIPGRQFPAHIHEVASEASRLTRTYRVTLILDQPKDVKILPGMTGEVRGKAELSADVSQSGLEVLPSALFQGDDGKASVWLFDEAAKKVKRQPVTTVRLNDNSVLVQGLTPGQLVVTAGVHFLKEGQEVRLLEDSVPAAAATAKGAQP